QAVNITVKITVTRFITWAASGFEGDFFDIDAFLLAAIAVVVVMACRKIIDLISQKIVAVKSGLAGGGAGGPPQAAKATIWQRFTASLKRDFTFQSFTSNFTQNLQVAFVSAVFDVMAQIGTDMLIDEDSSPESKFIGFVLAYIGNLTSEPGTYTSEGVFAFKKISYFKTFLNIIVDTYYGYKSRYKEWKVITIDEYGDEKIGDVKLEYQVGRLMFKRGLGSLYVSQPSTSQPQSGDPMADRFGEKVKSERVSPDDEEVERDLNATGINAKKIEIVKREFKDKNGNIIETEIRRKAGTTGHDGIISINQKGYSNLDLRRVVDGIVRRIPGDKLNERLIMTYGLVRGEDAIVTMDGDKMTVSSQGITIDLSLGDLEGEAKEIFTGVVDSAGEYRTIFKRVAKENLDLTEDKLSQIEKKMAGVEKYSEKNISSVGIEYDVFTSPVSFEFFSKDNESIGAAGTSGTEFSSKLGRNIKSELKKELKGSNLDMPEAERQVFSQLLDSGAKFVIVIEEDEDGKAIKEYFLGPRDVARDEEGNEYMIESRFIRNVKGDPSISLKGLKRELDENRKLTGAGADFTFFGNKERAKAFLEKEKLEKEAEERKEGFDEIFKDDLVDVLFEELKEDADGNFIDKDGKIKLTKKQKEKIKQYLKAAIGRGNLGIVIVMLYEKAMKKIASKPNKSELLTNLKNNVATLVKQTIEDNLTKNPKIAKQAFAQIVSAIQSENSIGNRDVAEFLQGVLDGVFGLELSKDLNKNLKNDKFSRIFKVTKFSKEIGSDLIGVSQKKITKLVGGERITFFAGSYFALKNNNGTVEVDKVLPGAMGIDEKTGDVVRVNSKGKLENLTKETKSTEKVTYSVDA
ncbi:MAG: hypothetical protein H8D54_04530, partial [Candidatus Omnitrophica bacterium]|nr:hypothetical protein [Candidatus Omnitrophota bacterium]